MIIQIPQGRATASTLSWVGDMYTINGEEFDFSQLLDGEVLPQEAVGSEFIMSDVKREGTELNFTYLRAYVEDETATQEDRFPPQLDNTGDSV